MGNISVSLPLSLSGKDNKRWLTDGRARQEYERAVRPVLDAAGVTHQLHVTRAAGHGTELAASLDLAHCDALLFLGGDGTVHEALQV